MATLTTRRIGRHANSNANDRGNSRDRANRRTWMFSHFADALGIVRCYRPECRRELVNWGPPDAENYMTVDRIIPACQGGRYIRKNIRPACWHCNTSTGAALANRNRVTLAA